MNDRGRFLQIARFERGGDPYMWQHGLWSETADEFLPFILEGGANATFPCEVAAGNDVVTIREKYGKNLIIFGGVGHPRIRRRDRGRWLQR